MSNEPKKTNEAAGKKKGSSSGSSEPDVFSLQNSEPSSNPIALSTLGRSSGTDKKIKTGPKVVLPGAVAQSTSASNGKLMSTQNTLTESVSGKEGTKGSNYRRPTITSPRFILEPRTATKERVSSSLGDNKAENQIEAFVITSSLKNSEPSALPASVKSPMSTQNTLTDFVSSREGKKGSNYHQRTIISPRFISKSRVASKERVSSSLTDNEGEPQIKAFAITSSLKNSEPKCFS